MDVFIRITRPIVKLMNTSASLVLKLFRAPLRGEGAVHSPEELKLIATATRRMGLLPVFQEEIIHRAIELNHVTVREIMTPRGKIFSLPANLSLEQASARIVDEQHSRVPVYDPANGPENIIGIVYSKDISRLMHFRSVALSLGGKGESGLTLRKVMRELDDEFDIAARSTVFNTAGVMSLDGSTTLRDLGTQLHWSFPREPGVETLAGFLLAHLGHIPVAGESVEYEARRYTIAEMAGRRISRVNVETFMPPPGELVLEESKRKTSKP
jgi:CBS domain containing-hemolysin-like protein